MKVETFREELIRAFLLCQAVEPLADKPGCTTRKVDSSPGTKLEYFIVSAANSAPSLFEIVERVVLAGKQPDCIFDVAYQAQVRSSRNRHGGKVNYAAIFMLLPLIVAQCLRFIEGQDPFSVFDTAKRTESVLKGTTVEDVSQLQKFVDHAIQLSTDHNRHIGKHRHQLTPKFVGNFSTVFDATNAKDFSHFTMVQEVATGYPLSLRAYSDFMSDPNVGILKRSEQIYSELIEKVNRPDIAADCLVTALYLYMCGNKTDVLFP